ncbi:hypothetical protein [Bacillus cereus]|uniref:hypothetical protein n=1 Tax=Bacillus cereus TaxID=1396 RepID=UPI002263D500|nr:hypothetical protein [Bacillus cereus]
MIKETPIKTLKINGEKVMCDSPVLNEPSAATFIPRKRHIPKTGPHLVHRFHHICS